MHRNILIFALALLLPSIACAQTYPQVSIPDLPPPPIGTSGYLIQGDTIPIDRVIDGDHGTYGVTFNPVGSCTSGQFVTSINIAGQPSCATPNFNAIAGTISLPQLGTAFLDGQILIGNSSTGQLNASTLTPGSGVTITNANGSITISATGGGSGATLGTSSLATVPQRSGQPGTGLYSSTGGAVDVASFNTQVAEFSQAGLNLAVGGYSGIGSSLTNLNASALSLGTVAPARLGQAYTNGQLLIGSTTSGQLVTSTLTAGSGVTVTNAPGSITIASTASGGTVPVTTVATSGTSQALAFPASGSVGYDITLTANCTITITGGTAGQQQSITIWLRQDSTAGRVPTLPAGIKWQGGIAPTPNTLAGRIDSYTITTMDAGTTLLGRY